MQTLKVNEISLKRAAEALNSSGIVIIPTETVYGVVARLDDEKAIKKIFEAKQRSFDKPVAIFLPERSQLKGYVSDIPKEAVKIMEKHWPGPLTLIFKKNDTVPKIVCGGTDKVGIRIPDHKVPKALMEECGPLVATSANLSGKPAPISAQDVTIDADLLLDGGKIEHGLASTVVDVTQTPPLILREGNIHPF